MDAHRYLHIVFRSSSMTKVQTSRQFFAKLAFRRLQRHLAASLLLTGSLSFFAASLQASGNTTTWTGGGSDDNWGTSGNWSGGVTPSGGGDDIINFAGSTRLTPNNNYTAFTQFQSILFSTGAGAFTLGGNDIKFYGKIENNSTSLQTVNFASIVAVGGNGATANQFNAVSGNLTINSAVILDNSSLLNVYGNNGKVLTFNGVISNGNATGSLKINQTSTVVLANTNTYTGDTTILGGGTLQFGTSLSATGSANSSALRLGASGNVNATVSLATLAGGQTISSLINPVSGNTGALLINSANTSGTNTLSGGIYLDSSLSTTTATGGVLALSGAISFQSAISRTLTVGGTGTTSLSGSTTNVANGTDVLSKTGAGTLALATTFTDAPLLKFNLNGGVFSLNATSNISTNTGVNYPDKIELLGSTTLQAANTLTVGNYTSATNNAGLKLTTGTLTLDVPTVANTLTVDGVISGGGALTKSTTGGTVVLTQANTYSGITTISGGALTATNQQAFGSGANAANQVNFSGASTVLNLLNNGGTGTVTGQTIIYGGAATSNNGYNLTASSGTINVGNNGNAGSTGNTIQLGAFSFGSGANTVNITSANSYGLKFNGSLSTPSANDIKLFNTGTPVEFTGGLTAGAGKQALFTGTGVTTIDGNLNTTTSGTGFIINVGLTTVSPGPGNLVVKGTSVDVTAANINGGTLTIYNPLNAPTSTGGYAPISMQQANATFTNSTLNLRNDADTNFGSAVTYTSGSPSINVDRATTAGGTGHTLTIGTLTSSISTTPNFTVTNSNGYNLSIGTWSATGSGVVLTNNMVNGTTTVAAYSSNYSGNGTLTFAGTSTTATTIVTGAITPLATKSLSVKQSSSGTTVLNGANTYNGTGASGTSVTSGTLLVNNTTGSGTGTTNVSVTGGTLGGSGTMSGNVSVSNGAIFSPGGTAGTAGNGTAILTTGALTLAGTYSLDLLGATVGTQYDQTKTTGAVTLTGSSLAFNSVNTSALTVGEKFYILLNGSATADTGAFTGANISGGVVSDGFGDTFQISYTDNGDGGTLGNDVSLTVLTAVPEPSTWFAGFLVLGTLGYSQRRNARRWLSLGRRMA